MASSGEMLPIVGQVTYRTGARSAGSFSVATCCDERSCDLSSAEVF